MNALLDELRAAAQRLQRDLAGLLPGLQAQAVAEIGSTSTQLLERVRAGHVAPALLAALHQSAGRGRMGRAWQSWPGASLAFSLALPFAPRDFGGLSLAVGVALAEALDPLPESLAPLPARAAGDAVRLKLKWPNDLLVADAAGPMRKVGGILIETLPLPAAERRIVVIGIGLNLKPQPDAGLSQGLACLAQWRADPTPASVLLEVMPPLAAALRRFEADGFEPSAAAFARRDALAGCPVRTSAADTPEGLAEGVEPDGALRLRLPDGRLVRIVSGEVSVRRRGED